MRILYAVTAQNDRTLELGKTLISMGHTTYPFYMDSFGSKASYFAKKLNAWGYKKLEEAYYERQCSALIRQIRALRPDKMLFINPNDRYVKLFPDIEQMASLSVYFIDPLEGGQKDFYLLPKESVYTYDAEDAK